MKPEIIERPRLLIAGVVGCGKDVTSIDIESLWDTYTKSEPGIMNRVGGTWLELHVGNAQGNGIYSVIVGAGIEEIGGVPVEVSVKVIPGGRYAHFTHCMKDGGFGEAFARVEQWVKESQTEVKDFGLQEYGPDFDPNNEDSVLHIYIPLEG